MQAGDDLRFMRRGFYWLHLETDSVVVRAEKEELFLKLSHGSSADVTSKQVLCFSNRRWHNHTRVGACGNTRALPAIMRHTSTEVNLYSWPTSVGHTIVTVSLCRWCLWQPHVWWHLQLGPRPLFTARTKSAPIGSGVQLNA